jgi:hypothetical protein
VKDWKYSGSETAGEGKKLTCKFSIRRGNNDVENILFLARNQSKKEILLEIYYKLLHDLQYNLLLLAEAAVDFLTNQNYNKESIDVIAKIIRGISFKNELANGTSGIFKGMKMAHNGSLCNVYYNLQHIVLEIIVDIA